MVIQITDDARVQVLDMLKNEAADAKLRFGVKGGGCSGLSYSIGFDYEFNEELDVVEVINDIPVIIHKPDIPVIKNTVIDFKQNLMGGGFSIKNPNATFACGCGSSFRTEAVAGEPGDC